MAKLIKVSPTKAFRVEAVQVGEVQGISIRQMYATQKDPKYKPARQGMFLPIEDSVAERVLRTAGKMAVNPDTEFTVLEPAERPSKNKSKSK
jgi:hypothetical protein